MSFLSTFDTKIKPKIFHLEQFMQIVQSVRQYHPISIYTITLYIHNTNIALIFPMSITLSPLPFNLVFAKCM